MLARLLSDGKVAKQCQKEIRNKSTAQSHFFHYFPMWSLIVINERVVRPAPTPDRHPIQRRLQTETAAADDPTQRRSTAKLASRDPVATTQPGSGRAREEFRARKQSAPKR